MNFLQTKKRHYESVSGGYFELSGSETIYVRCNKKTRYTVLHTSGTEGSFVSSVRVDGLVSRVWKQYRPKEYLIIYNDMEQWAVGSVHKIEITWEALLRHGTTGLYVSRLAKKKHNYFINRGESLVDSRIIISNKLFEAITKTVKSTSWRRRS